MNILKTAKEAINFSYYLLIPRYYSFHQFIIKKYFRYLKLL
jgi:hypothetical protein